MEVPQTGGAGSVIPPTSFKVYILLNWDLVFYLTILI